jgi:hypothetical protein
VGSEVYKYMPNVDLDTADPRLLLAFATEVYRRLLLGGMTHPLAWGSDSEASNTTNTADWMTTSPTTSDGGTQLEWGVVNDWFKDHFSPGTVIYTHTSSDNSKVEALPSADKVLLINKTNDTLSVQIAPGNIVTLTPYQVRCVER